MTNYPSIATSLPTWSEAQAIRRQAEQMRADHLRSLARRAFAALSRVWSTAGTGFHAPAPR